MKEFLIDQIDKNITALFESIKESGRFDEEVRQESIEVFGECCTSPTAGYYMTPEEHDAYLKLLCMKQKVRRFYHKVNDELERITY